MDASETPTVPANEQSSGAPPSASSRHAATAPSPALAPPPGNPRFPLFDGLRGIAVLAILDFHVSEFTGAIGLGIAGRSAEVLGNQAVITFFVISGFLLYRPFAAARAEGRRLPSVATYGRRRLLRILPAYWTVLTLLAVYPGIHGPFSADWWRYYGYAQLYSHQTLGGGIQVAWTLCVEVTYYIALPVWAYLVSRIRFDRSARGFLRSELVLLGAVMAAGLAIQMLADKRDVSYLVGVSLLGQCTWIFLGMALASVSVATQHDDRLLRWLRALAARSELCWAGSFAAFVGLAALVPAGGLFGLIATVETPQSLSRSLAKAALTAVFVTLLVLPAIFQGRRQGLPRRLLGSRAVVWLGVISYSFYLWHLTIVELLAVKHGPFSAAGLGVMAHIHVARTALLYLMSLGATAIIATLSYRFVELPFLRRKETSMLRRT